MYVRDMCIRANKIISKRPLIVVKNWKRKAFYFKLEHVIASHLESSTTWPRVRYHSCDRQHYENEVMCVRNA